LILFSNFSYRKRNPRADPLVCGIAVVLSVPFLAAALILSEKYEILTWIFIFTTETLLCTNWALISDMLMVRKNNKKREISSIDFVC